MQSHTPDLPSIPRSVTTLILLAACVQGVLLNLTWIGSKPLLSHLLSASTVNCIVAYSVSVPVVLALTLTQINDRRVWQHLGLMVLVQGAMLAWASWNSTAPAILPKPIWLPLTLGMVVAIFVALPWLQGRQRHGHWRVPYADLFAFSWQNTLCLMLALFFTGIGWAVLGLWAALFSLLGIDIFQELFFSLGFSIPASCMLFALGILIARTQHKPVQLLRHIKFALFKGLLPVLALILVLFFVSLPFTGLEALWRTGRAAWLLTFLIALLILFTNAVWQDGSANTPYPRWLRRVVEISLLTLPFCAVLVLYALGLRVNQYGWTVGRFFGMLIALLASAYALGYAFAVLRSWCPARQRTSPTWLAPIGRVNQVLSWVLIALAVLINTPILDAYRISAASQIARLHAELPALDVAVLKYLRFYNGSRGYQALQALRDDTNFTTQVVGYTASGTDATAQITAQDMIDDMLARAHPSRQAANTIVPVRRVADLAALRRHIVLAQDSQPPDEAWWQRLLDGKLEPSNCLDESITCVLRQIDLDALSAPNVLLCHVTASSDFAFCTIHGVTDGVWHNQGYTHFSWRDHKHDPIPDVKSALERAPLRAQTRRWPQLVLGEEKPVDVRDASAR